MYSNAITGRRVMFVLLIITTAEVWNVCEAKKKIGHLESKSHGVRGTVYILNMDQILIRQFKFTGKGDVDFYVGSSVGGSSNIYNGVLVSHTYTGRLNNHIVDDLVLDLPRHLTSDKIRWLAVVIHHAVAGEITFTQETQKENLKSGVGKPLDNLSNAVYTFLLLYFAI